METGRPQGATNPALEAQHQRSLQAGEMLNERAFRISDAQASSHTHLSGQSAPYAPESDASATHIRQEESLSRRQETVHEHEWSETEAWSAVAHQQVLSCMPGASWSSSMTMSRSSEAPIETLPNELLLHVFSFLDVSDLLALSRVGSKVSPIPCLPRPSMANGQDMPPSIARIRR